MGHYAFLDENNIVVEVITGRNENEVVDGISDWENYYGTLKGLTCKRTSYNTYANYHKEGGFAFRGNYAGFGYKYNSLLDAFIPPTPFTSWVIDENTFQWIAPTPKPTEEGDYVWSELQISWIIRPEKPDVSTAWYWDYETDQWSESA